MPPKNRAASGKSTILKNGNANKSIKTPAAEDDKPKPSYFPGWTGKTPLSLLYERCQREGWLKPEITPRFSRNEWHCTVTISKKVPKSSEPVKIIMDPPRGKNATVPFPADSAGEAKHFAAVYALFRFCNRLQLKMTLPPSARDYWSALEALKANSPEHDQWMWLPDPFSVTEDMKSKPKPPVKKSNYKITSSLDLESNAPSISSKQWEDAPVVSMSPDLRELVQQTVSSKFPPNDIFPSGNSSVDATSQQFKRFEAEGFRFGHIERAFEVINEQSRTDSSILQWLLLHVPESDLPSKWQLSSHHKSTQTTFTFHGAHNAKTDWMIDEIYQSTGYPRTVISSLMEQHPEYNNNRPLILRALQGMLLDDKEHKNYVINETGGLKERQFDELEVLKAIYDDRFQQQSEKEISILISTSNDARLHFILDSGTPYPSPNSKCLPVLYISSPSLPDYIRLHLTIITLSYAIENFDDQLIAGTGGVISELVEHLSDVVPNVLKRPPLADMVYLRFKNPSGQNSIMSSPSDSSDSLVSKTNHLHIRKSTKHNKQNGKNTDTLSEEFEQLQKQDSWRKMIYERNKLPASEKRKEIVSMIENNQVTIISGETGSGKTTQVPAFILEYHLSNRSTSTCNIIVTQPRRVATIGVASRVAQERMEDISSPKTVGYVIRGERRTSSSTKLTFCTTGVLLRRMADGVNNLKGISHIFVDEVHERSLDSDLLLLKLKHIVKKNKHIKIILMSATLNSQLFQNYFGTGQCLHIPGRTFPVVDYYLEDVICKTGYQANSLKAARSYTTEEMREMKDALTSQGLNEQEARTVAMISRAERIDYGLVAATVDHILKTSTTNGSILIFMPGVAEIRTCIQTLKALPSVSRHDLYIMGLHANQSSSEQARIFTQKGRKIVISTNVAETSVTIDDITVVIDCGRVKETRYDTQTNLVRLIEMWTSQASCRQRRGRAGRTRPGECWKIFSKQRESEMDAHTMAEINRTPLDSLILHVKATSVDEDLDLIEYLSDAIEPPKIEAIETAWETLLELGAVEGTLKTSHITPLGCHLALLPMDLRIGKMLVLGVIFRCLEPIVTLAACFSTKGLFISPDSERTEAEAAKRKLATSSSDPLVELTAFNLCDGKSKKEQRLLFEENFISPSVFHEVCVLRQEYIDALESSGSIPLTYQQSSKEKCKEHLTLNMNSENDNLLKALIFAGNSDKIVRISRPDPRYTEIQGESVRKDDEARQFKFFEENTIGGRVFLHPSSTLFHQNKFKSSFLTFLSINVTSKPFIRNVTEVPIYGLLVFGGSIYFDLQQGGISVSTTRKDPPNSNRRKGWLYLKAWPRIGALVSALRSSLEEELQTCLQNPSATCSETPRAISVMSQLIMNDGE